jgi:hypothetical protein
MTHEHYPLFAKFFAAWLHQDFDLEGSKLADVLAAYKRVTSRTEQAALAAEVARFKAAHPDDTEQAIERIFEPEVIVTAMSGSGEAFLREILEAVADA